MMNKTIGAIALVVMLAALAVAGATVVMRNREAAVNEAPQDTGRIETQPQLTREEALTLLQSEMSADGCRAEGVEGSYVSCTVSITETSGNWLVTVTHSGLYDDSVDAVRLQTTVTRQDGRWVRGPVTKSYSCGRPGMDRGFRTELCP